MFIDNVDEIIFNLREEGLSFDEIKEELSKQNINYSISQIRNKSQKAYDFFEKDAPKYSQVKVSDEEIIKLRQNGYTYKKILEELEKQGKKINYSTLASRCEKLCKDKYEIDDKEMLRLRLEEGLSYQEIADKLSTKEKKMTLTIVRYRCIKLCEERHIDLGKSKRGKKGRNISSIDEEIIRLREEEGKTFKEIGTMLSDKKIRSKQEISRRYERISKINSQRLAKMILNLMKTKKATLEQVQVIAEYYGVDLEKTMNSLEK